MFVRRIPATAWHYAILLILLFTIAAIAARETVDYLHDRITDPYYEDVVRAASSAIWAFTLGFMFLAGAFGLWAVQFSSEAESFRRIGLFVEDMDYLRDGLISLDKRGRIVAANPAFRTSFPSYRPESALTAIFTGLTTGDVERLIDSHSTPIELEAEADDAEARRRTYRLRSQPSGGLRLVLISDVTARKAEDQRRQQDARLQLVGRMARGVAHDFNNILCTVAGHASLLPRLKAGSLEMKASVDAIARETRRGADLAAHLAQLSRSESGAWSESPSDSLRKAVDLLRLGLAPQWQVQFDVADALPPTTLSSLRLEQAVMNLGLLIADTAGTPAVLRITAGEPADEGLMRVDAGFGLVVLLSSAQAAEGAPIAALAADGARTEDSGVIESVVQTMIEEAGGRLDSFRTESRRRIYRIVLPRAPAPSAHVGDFAAAEFIGYVAGWRVLLVEAAGQAAAQWLGRAGVAVDQVDSVTEALNRIDDQHAPDAIVLDKRLLGTDTAGLLHAVAKLCPSAALVVLCPEPEVETDALRREAVPLAYDSGLNALLQGMIEAKGLAIRRRGR